MTEAKHSKVAKEYRIPAGSPLAQAWKIALVLGVVGLVIAVVGYTLDPRRFAFAYLMGFVTVAHREPEYRRWLAGESVATLPVARQDVPGAMPRAGRVLG